MFNSTQVGATARWSILFTNSSAVSVTFGSPPSSVAAQRRRLPVAARRPEHSNALPAMRWAGE
jgi:hypothetical protein